MDAPLALYRRYRPDSFDQVIGQDHVTEPLRAALRANRVNHAYLFSGPRGCGKTTSARILARALNCAKGPTDTPCGICDSCVDLATGGPGSVDVIEIDAASHNGVDDARELREQATFQPMRDRYKIYILDEAHMVTNQGFNALLKIVEEPPEHVRFIFATTEPDKVIGTVRSRTHHYPFRLIPPKVLSSYLAEVCAKEGAQIEPAALSLVVRAGGGSARDTLSVLDQLIAGAGDDGVTHTLAAGLLGFTPDALLDEVIDSFAAHDAAGVFGVVDKVLEIGQDPRRFTEDLLQRLRDLVVISAIPDAVSSGLIDAPVDQAERLSAQAARFGRHDLLRAADVVAEALTELKGTSVPRLMLELLCARVLLPGADDTERGLSARVDRMERRLTMSGAPPDAREVTSRAQPSPPAPSRPAAPPTAAPLTAAPPTAPERSAGQGATGAAPAAGASEKPDKAAEPARPPAPPQRAPEPARAAGAPLSLADVRRLWPDVVEAVKTRRKVTWMQLTQHAQVVGFADGVLTVGFNNVGARESFVKGGSDTIVQQAVIDLVGQEWRVEAINDPSAQPAAKASTSPSSQPKPVEEQHGAHRDDADVETVNGPELLSSRLGAQVIEEIPHE